jgi:hypothetical protein
VLPSAPRRADQARVACKWADDQAADGQRRRKNRPVAAPEQADRLVIQAIYRRFTDTSPYLSASF